MQPCFAGPMAVLPDKVLGLGSRNVSFCDDDVSIGSDSGDETQVAAAANDFDAETGLNLASDAANDAKLSHPRTCRQYVWEFLSLNMAHHLPRWLRRGALIYHVSTAALVVLLIIVDNTTSPTVTTTSYWICELCATVLWAGEYILRLWSSVEREAEPHGHRERLSSGCRSRVREALKPQLVLDLLAIGSLIIDLIITDNSYRGFSALRMLRLVTVVRIERGFLFSGVMTVVKKKIPLLAATLGIALVVMLVASVLMFYIENQVNPAFASVLMSMWWCTTALTTVGYGDIYPTTGLGRCLGSMVAFMGIGLFAMPAGILASGFQEQIEKQHREWRRRKRRQQKLLGKGQEHSEEKSPVTIQEALASEVTAMRKELRKATVTIASRSVSEAQLDFCRPSLSPVGCESDPESVVQLQELKLEVVSMRSELRNITMLCTELRQFLKPVSASL